MATTVTKTVGPGMDYETLAAWQAGEVRDLVAADEIARAVCHNFEDTTPVVIDGWTVDADRYPLIEAADDHGGVWSTDAYRLVVSAFGAAVGMDVKVEHITLRGLQLRSIKTGGTSDGGAALEFSTDNEGPGRRAEKCICVWEDQGVAGGNQRAFESRGSVQSSRLSNCVFIIDAPTLDASANARCVHIINSPAYWIHNCSGTGGTTGLDNGSTGTRAKNCTFSGNDTDYAGSFHADSTNNVSGDATAPGSNVVTGESAASLWADPGNFDLHLAAGSAAIDAGANLSSDPDLAVTEDIAGNSRPQGSAFDSGAFEAAAAGITLTLPTVL